MMKSKVFTLTLVFLFFTSTTGLPVVLHYCEMMQAASLSECEMHNPEKEIIPCCEQKDTDKLILKNADDECCQLFLVDKSLKENFITSKTELSQNQISLLNIDIESSLLSLDNIIFLEINSSPPPLINNHLYLDNSILLI